MQNFTRKIFLVLSLGGGLVITASIPGWSSISLPAAMNSFTQANEAYKAGQYGEAQILYEEIISGGLVSGPLYYNLANSYFKEGELGKAILNYERARNFMPRDQDLRANYQYALSLTEDRVGGTSTLWQKAISRHIQFYTLDEMALILFVLALAMGGIFLLALYLGWPKRRVTGLMVLLAVVFIIYVVGLIAKMQYAKDLAVAVQETEAKFEPRREATTHFDLFVGGKAKILQESGAWLKIKRWDGKQGWVLKEHMERL